MATLTSTRPVAPAQRPGVLRRFFRTPKGMLLLILIGLAALAIPANGWLVALGTVCWCVGVAAFGDVALARISWRRWHFPDGAILTGLILALILSPGTPWPILVLTTLAAIGSKYLFRTPWSNVLNPAAVGLVVAGLVFNSGQSWWGALPDLPVPALLILLALGLFIADRVNKLPMVLIFLGLYFALFSAAAFVQDPARVAEIFRTPDLQAALFFAFFMLDDPPTCPTRYRDQVRYGALVALATFAIFLIAGVVYFLPAGLLIGNLWESWRRLTVRLATRGPGGARVIHIAE